MDVINFAKARQSMAIEFEASASTSYAAFISSQDEIKS
jgi:hypothetical protein